MIGCERGSVEASLSVKPPSPLAGYQCAHDTRDRAHVPFKLLEHLPLVTGPMTPVRRTGLWASTQVHPRREDAVAGLRRAARGALGTAGEVVVRSFKCESACRDYAVYEIRSSSGSDPTGNLGCCFCESCVLRRSNACRDPTHRNVRAVAPCDILLELAVSPKSLSETLPTRTLLRYEQWPNPDLHPHGLHQKPSFSGDH